ncbi:MAG: S49 family peptidase, partial [Methylobacter tundripaludum]|nr:S49 family peptidase [Methylobacter tundripaludum]
MDNQNKPEVTRESGWEREVIEKLALAAITEQTRARRWGVFFKSLMFVYLIAVFGVAMYPKLKQD